MRDEYDPYDDYDPSEEYETVYCNHCNGSGEDRHGFMCRTCNGTGETVKIVKKED